MSTAAALPKSENKEFTDAAYFKIRDLIYRMSGIYYPEEKLYFLGPRCERRMKAVNVKTAGEYLEYLTAPRNRDSELRLLLNEMTVGETYMFRSPAQLDALRNVILPQIMESKSRLGLKRIRLWSAGCSTGEEPYTLAMFLLEESQKLLAGWTFDILATDLNDNALTAAKAGIYGEYATRNISQAQRNKYFTKHDEKHLQVSEKLKSAVRFDRVNLSDDSKMTFLKGFDVIFCCNVLIYFDLNSKRKVTQHFFANLLPGGYLFLGHAESLYQVDDQFRLVHFPGAVGYCKPAIPTIARGKP